MTVFSFRLGVFPIWLLFDSWEILSWLCVYHPNVFVFYYSLIFMDVTHHNQCVPSAYFCNLIWQSVPTGAVDALDKRGQLSEHTSVRYLGDSLWIIIVQAVFFVFVGWFPIFISAFLCIIYYLYICFIYKIWWTTPSNFTLCNYLWKENIHHFPQ